MHSSSVTPRTLIATLIAQRGMSELEAAKAMRSATFQGTLHRFLHDETRSPSRATAEVIAKYFRLPVDAVYDPAVAARVAISLGINPDDKASAPLRVEDTVTPYGAPARSFSADLQRRLNLLSDEQFALVERAVLNTLDALGSAPSASKRRAA